jgi:hypothetical protein
MPPGVAGAGARWLKAVTVAMVTAGAATPASGQALDDPRRLLGIESVSLRSGLDWDELITTEAGGATAAQFARALEQGMAEVMRAAAEAPSVDGEAAHTLRCHVDTFYDVGLVVYGLRVQVERPEAGGEAPVAVWIESHAGSYALNQLHLLSGLGRRCAERFLDAWRSAARS